MIFLYPITCDSGLLEKMLDSATELEIQNLPQSALDLPFLSTDQNYGYRMSTAIKTGVVSIDLALLEIDFRWFTTALRFMKIWISKHKHKRKALKNVRMIVEFCVWMYIANWFNIKINSKWTRGPRFILYQ